MTLPLLAQGAVTQGCFDTQEDFLACMAARMGGITDEARAVAAAMAAGHGLRSAAEGAAAAASLADAAGWGFVAGDRAPPEEPPALERFVVELDQRFLTELAHTAALFGELFEQSGRRRLLKVTCFGLVLESGLEHFLGAGVVPNAVHLTRPSCTGCPTGRATPA